MSKNKKDITFQILDCGVFNEKEYDEDLSDEEELSDEDFDLTFKKKFIVQLFGRTSKGKSVSVSVTDFTPFFFVKIPDVWSKRHVNKFANWVKNEMLPKYRGNVVSIKKIKKHKFYGFSDFEKFTFVRFVFTNTMAMRNCKKIFQQDYYYKNDKVKFKYLESANEKTKKPKNKREDEPYDKRGNKQKQLEKKTKQYIKKNKKNI